MATDLTFQQVNDTFTQPIFTISGSTISLNVALLTGDTYTALTDTGVVECCFKLLRTCYQSQKDLNGNNTTNRLESFTSPFYGTVQETNPPTIQGSITVTGKIPLNVDNVIGTQI
jgi:hypothetical protein